MKLRPKRIIDLEIKIKEIRTEKDKLVLNEKREEVAKLRDTEQQLIEQLNDEEKNWNEYLRQHGISEVSRFCLRVKNGTLEVLVEQANGTFVLADGTKRLESDVYIFSDTKWNKILSELEKLINKRDLKEQELQDFFEAYPELVLDEKYEYPIPQATIVNDNDIEWRADFVLVPKDQVSFAKILELKLPNENISTKSVTGHSRYSTKLFHAINQLKDYYEAFASEKSKNKFKEKYNTEVFKPDLQLLFGRRQTINNTKEFLELQRRNGLEIKDWDSLLEQLQKKYA